MPNQQKNNTQPNSSNISQKSLRRWHRWVGYSSLFFVMILSLTGLILNRSEYLNLNQIIVQNEFIASLYGQSPSEPPIHFKTNDHLLSWLEGRVYLDGKLFARNTDRLTGGAILGDLIVISAKNSLSLYMIDGSLMEKLDSSSLPGQITALGQSPAGQIIIETPDGSFIADNDFISWEKTSDKLTPSPDLAYLATEQVTQDIMQDFKGQGVTLSRVILDLHSGNIMGSYGSYIMDLAALSLIFLGITGFMKRKKSDKDRRRKK
ncbi:MAG: PepSY domain-containing protein [Emcibacter sp.]|nr:PepSY domain-containing protein [Emcibacter sp.]